MSKNVAHSVEQGLVLCDDRDGVATLTLNSATNFNALSGAMIAALQTALDSIAQRDDILLKNDDDHFVDSATSDRKSARRCNCCWLPTRGNVRSRSREL
jgi:hypothetical protein